MRKLKLIIRNIIPNFLLQKFNNYRNKVKLINCNYTDTVGFAYESQVSNCNIGDFTSIGRYDKIVHTDFGRYCSVSWDVTINAIGHEMNKLTTHSFARRPDFGFGVEKDGRVYKRVIIKNDVWIGANTVVMPGLTIGNGAIIGAGAVVTKDVPDYAIVVGVPAKVIKYRFSKEIIEELLKLKWWNWDREVIKNNIHLFQSEITEDTINKLKNIASN